MTLQHKTGGRCRRLSKSSCRTSVALTADLQLAGLSHRVDCQYLLMTSNNDSLRPLKQHATATQGMANACTYLFKNTFDEVATRMESFTTAGLDGIHTFFIFYFKLLTKVRSGALKGVGKKRINILKKEGRELILNSLRTS